MRKYEKHTTWGTVLVQSFQIVPQTQMELFVEVRILILLENELYLSRVRHGSVLSVLL